MCVCVCVCVCMCACVYACVCVCVCVCAGFDTGIFAVGGEGTLALEGGAIYFEMSTHM